MMGNIFYIYINRVYMVLGTQTVNLLSLLLTA